MAFEQEDEAGSPEYVVLHVKMPKRLLDSIEEFAREKLTGPQTVVRLALLDYLTLRGRLR